MHQGDEFLMVQFLRTGLQLGRDVGLERYELAIRGTVLESIAKISKWRWC